VGNARLSSHTTSKDPVAVPSLMVAPATLSTAEKRSVASLSGKFAAGTFPSAPNGA
jgi:hypothetical protein